MTLLLRRRIGVVLEQGPVAKCVSAVEHGLEQGIVAERIDYAMVFYLESGRVRHIVDGQEFILEPGDFHVIPAFSIFAGETLEDVVAWEAIAPPRQDLAIRADDMEI